MAILQNKYQTSVVVHATANASWVITGNNSVSNVAVQDEVLTGASIKQVWCGSASGNGMYWTVTAGNSTVNSIVGVYDSTAWIDYAGTGVLNSAGSTGDNIYVTLNNPAGGDGYIMMELRKHGTANDGKQ